MAIRRNVFTISEGGRTMRNIELLVAALEYIELHLSDEIRTDDIAVRCFCSKSTLEKLFRNVHNISVHEYIVRRRMMLAAKKISKYPQISILDIALEYGYSSHESFARAFEKIWNCKPSEFRTVKFTELYPRLNAAWRKGDNPSMQKKSVDISELYDLFQERRDCYFVTCDVKNLMPINDISRKAGDLAILEQMRRMTISAGENDVVFRIGGDEFCILTDSSEAVYAEQVADKIRSMNQHPFSYDNKEIPLSLHVATVSLKSCQHKEEVFDGLHSAIEDSKA